MYTRVCDKCGVTCPPLADQVRIENSYHDFCGKCKDELKLFMKNGTPALDPKPQALPLLTPYVPPVPKHNGPSHTPPYTLTCTETKPFGGTSRTVPCKDDDFVDAVADSIWFVNALGHLQTRQNT